MSVTLSQGLLLEEIADALYEFLPGKPHPHADPRISFPGVAAEVGLAHYWRNGSKRPTLRHLLESALGAGGKFCPLILLIVQRGITKRKSSNPIHRSEIECLNNALLKLGYKIPELVDPAFLDALPQAKQSNGNPVAGSATVSHEELLRDFSQLQSLAPQPRGFAFEKFLVRLFGVFSLAPREAFRNTGEQIDGSFTLTGEYYLLEAKWQNIPIGNEELLAFSGKIARKSEWSRGACISWSGFSRDGLIAFGGRPTNIICIDGLDLFHVLQGKLHLPAVLEAKVRRAAESGKPYVSVRDLFPSVI